MLAAAQEFNHNSRASVSEALVRILKLSFKRIDDVVPFVAPDSCALLPLEHQLTLSLEPIQV